MSEDDVQVVLIVRVWLSLEGLALVTTFSGGADEEESTLTSATSSFLDASSGSLDGGTSKDSSCSDPEVASSAAGNSKLTGSEGTGTGSDVGGVMGRCSSCWSCSCCCCCCFGDGGGCGVKH